VDGDDLITLTDAQRHYGTTAKDMAAIVPKKQYHSRRRKCTITLFEPADVESYVIQRYGSLEHCKALATERRVAAQARADGRRAAEEAAALQPPEGWPVVGTFRDLARWAALDTETTGLDPASGHRVIEVAVIIVENGVVAREWSARINPGPDTVWTAGAIEINGIGPTDVDGAPAATEIWAEFAALTAGLPLAAHNASFDARFVNAEMIRHGHQPRQDWHCTMVAATRFGQRWPRLGDLFWKYARRHIDGAHTALGDAKAVAYLAPRLYR
jgi:DNA polymerase-3 subunit epsilon